MFQFCCVVTERPATSTMHGVTDLQPGASLEWPVLLAVNSVVGCFLAALATGYTFFQSWEKYVATILRKSKQEKRLAEKIVNNCGVNSCNNEPLYCNCKCFNDNEFTKTCDDKGKFDKMMNACNEDSYIYSGIHYKVAPCGAKCDDFNNCNKSCQSNNTQFCALNARKSECEESKTSHATDSYSQWSSNGNQYSSTALSNELIATNKPSSVQFDALNISNIEHDFPSRVCEDPICQWEQLRLKRQSHLENVTSTEERDSISVDKMQFLSQQNLTPHIDYHKNDRHAIYDETFLREGEHLYCNMICESTSVNKDFATIGTLHNEKIQVIPEPVQSHNLQLNCKYCKSPPTYRDDSDRYLYNERKQSPYFDNINQRNFVMLGNYSSYSTLPSKITTLELLSGAHKATNFSRMNFKSCQDLNDYSERSLNYSSLDSPTEYSWKYSSIQNLSQNYNSFDGSRKAAKSVKFQLG